MSMKGLLPHIRLDLFYQAYCLLFRCSLFSQKVKYASHHFTYHIQLSKYFPADFWPTKYGNFSYLNLFRLIKIQ